VGSMVAVMTRTCPRALSWRPVLLLAGNGTDASAGVRSTPGSLHSTPLGGHGGRDVLLSRPFTGRPRARHRRQAWPVRAARLTVRGRPRGRGPAFGGNTESRRQADTP
jgi:hypothetical protein